jgi:hypothetical protein
MGLDGIHGLKAEVIKDEQVDAQQPAQLLLIGAVEARGLEPFEDVMRATEEDRAKVPLYAQAKVARDHHISVAKAEGVSGEVVHCLHPSLPLRS